MADRLSARIPMNTALSGRFSFLPTILPAIKIWQRALSIATRSLAMNKQDLALWKSMQAAAKRLDDRFGSRQPHATAKPEPTASQNPLPSKLYKYTERKWAELLVTEGCIRVGTMYDFRYGESHGPGIKDVAEGTNQLVVNAEEEGIRPGSLASQQLAAVHGMQSAPDGPPNFKNITFGRFVDHPDAFVWCCSTEKSKSAMAAIDKADTCVEIFDVAGFCSALDRAVKSKEAVRLLGSSVVRYDERVEMWNGQSVNMGAHPVFLKGREFDIQKEFRIAWQPTMTVEKLGYLIFKTSDAGQFCKIVDL